MFNQHDTGLEHRLLIG